MTTATDAIAAVRALHQAVAAAARCDAEEWAPTHYGQAVDPYWIGCTRVGRHDEHSDAGNTGLTWPLSEEDRAVQERLPLVCDVDGEGYPCSTVQLLADVPPRRKWAVG